MKPFYDTIRKSRFGGRLTQGQVDGLSAILTEGRKRNMARDGLLTPEQAILYAALAEWIRRMVAAGTLTVHP